MASTPISGDAAHVTLPGTIPPMPAVARVLRQFDRAKLGAAIEVMIGVQKKSPNEDQCGWRGGARPIRNPIPPYLLHRAGAASQGAIAS